ncbi:hypothetical protein ROZALSC1DRAFT_27821, partial [Rozella allomycis CSF55]
MTCFRLEIQIRKAVENTNRSFIDSPIFLNNARYKPTEVMFQFLLACPNTHTVKQLGRLISKKMKKLYSDEVSGYKIKTLRNDRNMDLDDDDLVGDLFRDQSVVCAIVEYQLNNQGKRQKRKRSLSDVDESVVMIKKTKAFNQSTQTLGDITLTDLADTSQVLSDLKEVQFFNTPCNQRIIQTQTVTETPKTGNENDIKAEKQNGFEVSPEKNKNNVNSESNNEPNNINENNFPVNDGMPDFSTSSQKRKKRIKIKRSEKEKIDLAKANGDSNVVQEIIEHAKQSEGEASKPKVLDTIKNTFNPGPPLRGNTPKQNKVELNLCTPEPTPVASPIAKHQDKKENNVNKGGAEGDKNLSIEKVEIDKAKVEIPQQAKKSKVPVEKVTQNVKDDKIATPQKIQVLQKQLDKPNTQKISTEKKEMNQTEQVGIKKNQLAQKAEKKEQIVAAKREINENNAKTVTSVPTKPIK